MAEAQQAMSYAEFCDWVKYRNQRGPMHMGTRIDRAIARALALFARTQKWQGEPPGYYDFLPHEPAPEVEPDINTAFAFLRHKAKE